MQSDCGDRVMEEDARLTAEIAPKNGGACVIHNVVGSVKPNLYGSAGSVEG